MTDTRSAERESCGPEGQELCEWAYDPGDDSVGYAGGWVCKTCGAVDVDSEPPSDPDADAYERNL